MKNYNNFVNDELNEGKVIQILVIMTLVIGVILVYPIISISLFYKRYISKDIKLFLNEIEKFMDILYTYIKYINNINVDLLNDDELKKINKIKKILIKKFKTIEPSEGQIKNYFIKKFKIKKEEDKKIIKNYNFREYKLGDKKLINFILELNYRINNEYNELDPFNEDEWEEDNKNDDIDYYLNKTFYVAHVDMYDNNNIPPYFGKLDLIYYNGNYGFGKSFDNGDYNYLIYEIDKNEFLFNVNKFNTSLNINKINFLKYRYIIVSEDNKELFKQSISHNFNFIKKHIFHIKKDYNLYHKLTPDSLIKIMNNYDYDITYYNISDFF